MAERASFYDILLKKINIANIQLPVKLSRGDNFLYREAVLLFFIKEQSQ